MRLGIGLHTRRGSGTPALPFFGCAMGWVRWGRHPGAGLRGSGLWGGCGAPLYGRAGPACLWSLQGGGGARMLPHRALHVCSFSLLLVAPFLAVLSLAHVQHVPAPVWAQPGSGPSGSW